MMETCGRPALAGPCGLRVGHNMGRADVPENHLAPPPQQFEVVFRTTRTVIHTTTLPALPRKREIFYEGNDKYKVFGVHWSKAGSKLTATVMLRKAHW